MNQLNNKVDNIQNVTIIKMNYKNLITKNQIFVLIKSFNYKIKNMNEKKSNVNQI